MFGLFKKKIIIEDDIFGTLEYHTSKKTPEQNYYAGKTLFQGIEIDVFITTHEGGPTENQRMYYTMLQEKYLKIKKDHIIPYLKKEFEDCTKEMGINSFNSEFELQALSINNDTKDHMMWSISYYSNPMHHSITITFQETTPVEVTIDG